MSEGISTPSHGAGAGPEAGGLPPQSVPTVKKFFFVEYLEEVRRGFAWMRTSPKPDEHIMKKVTRGLQKWSKLRKARIGMAVVVVIIVAASGLFSGQAGSVRTIDKQDLPPGQTGNAAKWPFSGTVNENGNISFTNQTSVAALTAMQATLSWTDETAGALLMNNPDALGLQVTAPNGHTWMVNTTTTSPVTWNLPEAERAAGAGEWKFTVLGGTMGDIVRAAGPSIGCIRCGPDNSNAFTLSVDLTW